MSRLGIAVALLALSGCTSGGGQSAHDWARDDHAQVLVWWKQVSTNVTQHNFHDAQANAKASAEREAAMHPPAGAVAYRESVVTWFTTWAEAIYWQGECYNDAYLITPHSPDDCSQQEAAYRRTDDARVAMDRAYSEVVGL